MVFLPMRDAEVSPCDSASFNRDGVAVLFATDGVVQPFVTGLHLMRLFLIAFSLSACLTLASNWVSAQEPESSGSQPIRSSRFQTSAAQAYLMQRARQDSDHRVSLLRYYDSIGFNYGAPEINGSVYFNAAPPLRFRRAFVIPQVLMPLQYGM